jgi:hypothetical protein
LLSMVFMGLLLGFWLLHVRVETRHVHAERHLAKAGVANGKVFERSFLGVPRAAWGSQNPKGEWPWRARGAEPPSRVWFPHTCATAHMFTRRALREEASRRGGSGKRKAVEARRKLPPYIHALSGKALELSGSTRLDLCGTDYISMPYP